MRLLCVNNSGKLELTKDFLEEADVPPYAILSHTWQEGQEVTFEDFTKGTGKEKSGYQKIIFCEEELKRSDNAIRHFWIDTCCINKADPVELQTAINSMFRWYRDADVCWVYLQDVSTNEAVDKSSWRLAFRKSRWFERGWTLQELIAPNVVKFYSRERSLLGDRNGLGEIIHGITDLPLDVLVSARSQERQIGSDRKPLHAFGVEQRLSWSARRMTTRPEDKAYSLLGIFDVYMPLIYGEGQANAFRRLRRELQEHRYATPASVQFTKQYDCLRSISYFEQEHRLGNIHSATNTCEWIFQVPDFVRWQVSTCSALWIKGNPGVGKSVLMKHILKNVKTKAGIDDGLIVSSFIYGQGTELQRTPLGVIRALLSQLLDQFPDILTEMTRVFKEREVRFGAWSAGKWVWNLRELQETLADLLLKQTHWRPVTIFVDALDECSEETAARSLLAYFRDLIDRGKATSARFRICLSSRHYPIIGHEAIPSIHVEEGNSKDIQWYIWERIKDMEESKRNEIGEMLLLKAQGGFQWVYLVTESLIVKDLAGYSSNSLVMELTRCPQTLGDLYTATLRDASRNEQRLVTRLFQWVLFSERPLSSQELRDALALDTKLPCASYSDLQTRESWSDTLEGFEKYVRFISKGLITFRNTTRRVDSYSGHGLDRDAQLVHQSVADYLTSNGSSNAVYSHPAVAHHQILQTCLRYITFKEVLEHSCCLRGSLSSHFPLLVYATQYMFKHLRKAESIGVPRHILLARIGWKPISNQTSRLATIWGTFIPALNGMDLFTTHWPVEGATIADALVALGSKIASDAVVECLTSTQPWKSLQLSTGEIHQGLVSALLDPTEWQRQHTKQHCGNRMDQETSSSSDQSFVAPTVFSVVKAEATVFKELMKSDLAIERMNREAMLVAFAIAIKDIYLLKHLLARNLNSDSAVYFTLNRNAECYFMSIREPSAVVSKLHAVSIYSCKIGTIFSILPVVEIETDPSVWNSNISWLYGAARERSEEARLSARAITQASPSRERNAKGKRRRIEVTQERTLLFEPYV